MLRYQADATVRGLVSRLGTATLTAAGGHFTTCFFRALDRALGDGVLLSGPAPTARWDPAHA